MRKLGNSSKIPCRISQERFEIRRWNSVCLSTTSIPTHGIFFRIFRQGVGERNRPQFLKKSAGVNGWPVAGSPSQKTWNVSTGNFGEKARKCSSGAGIFIFELGWLRCPPKVTPFFEGTAGTTLLKIHSQKTRGPGRPLVSRLAVLLALYRIRANGEFLVLPPIYDNFVKTAITSMRDGWRVCCFWIFILGERLNLGHPFLYSLQNCSLWISGVQNQRLLMFH